MSCSRCSVPSDVLEPRAGLSSLTQKYLAMSPQKGEHGKAFNIDLFVLPFPAAGKHRLARKGCSCKSYLWAWMVQSESAMPITSGDCQNQPCHPKGGEGFGPCPAQGRDWAWPAEDRDIWGSAGRSEEVQRAQDRFCPQAEPGMPSGTQGCKL